MENLIKKINNNFKTIEVSEGLGNTLDMRTKEEKKKNKQTILFCGWSLGFIRVEENKFLLNATTACKNYVKHSNKEFNNIDDLIKYLKTCYV